MFTDNYYKIRNGYVTVYSMSWYSTTYWYGSVNASEAMTATDGGTRWSLYTEASSSSSDSRKLIAVGMASFPQIANTISLDRYPDSGTIQKGKIYFGCGYQTKAISKSDYIEDVSLSKYLTVAYNNAGNSTSGQYLITISNTSNSNITFNTMSVYLTGNTTASQSSTNDPKAVMLWAEKFTDVTLTPGDVATYVLSSGEPLNV